MRNLLHPQLQQVHLPCRQHDCLMYFSFAEQLESHTSMVMQHELHIVLLTKLDVMAAVVAVDILAIVWITQVLQHK